MAPRDENCLPSFKMSRYRRHGAVWPNVGAKSSSKRCQRGSFAVEKQLAQVEKQLAQDDTNRPHSAVGFPMPDDVPCGVHTILGPSRMTSIPPSQPLRSCGWVRVPGLKQSGSRLFKSSGLGFRLLFVVLLIGVGPAAFAQGDTQPPTITGLSPLPGAISQAVTTNVKATFSEAIQPSSVAFVLRDSANVAVPASVSYDSSTFTVTLHPSSDLIASRSYTATVSGAVDLAGNPIASPSVWSFSTGQPGFQESVVFSGLQNPTAFQFASDGRVFVAEKSGVIMVFSSLTADNPSVFADLRTNVDNTGNRGLLGLALAPGFPTVPYVYVFYTYNTPTTGIAKGRISRLQASGNVMTGVEQALVDDWYQQYPGQPVGNLTFGPDGALYAAAGDGASSSFVDTGQTDTSSPDPPNEGGALRSQDLRTPGDPVTLDGAVIRIQPDTGQAVRENLDDRRNSHR